MLLKTINFQSVSFFKTKIYKLKPSGQTKIYHQVNPITSSPLGLNNVMSW